MSDIANFTLYNELHSKVSSETIKYFGYVGEPWILYATDHFWDETSQDFRLDDLKLNRVFPGSSHKVLDLAAGCGQFIFRALDSGYDCYGIEPEKWKLNFIEKKIKEFNRPIEWLDRFTDGVGECMPYENSSFDCVTSYQTLEHVQDPYLVIKEMVRVTKLNGIIIIRCPNYLGTYEAHYRLPWLPVMPRFIAKAYLKLLGRPTIGLDTIQYITKSKILRWITDAECELNCKLMATDSEFISVSNGMRRRGLLMSFLGYSTYCIANYFINFFKREPDIHLVIRVISKTT